jgi:RNA exonuclease 4
MIRNLLKALENKLTMSGLSSNWKKLQTKIKAESTSQPAAPKRKADDDLDHQPSSANGAKAGPRKKQKKEQQQKQKRAQSPKRPTKTSPRKAPKSPKPFMGNTQSSKIDPISPKHGIAPSLAVWAADNDISSESIAEAYSLGLKNQAGHSIFFTADPGRANEGLAPDVEVGKYLAIDCEMVGVGEGGREDSLARVSVVDFLGKQVYDSFVKQREPVVNWRTRVSGVAPKHMATARPFDEVQAQIASLLKGRILVGHDVKHDLQALQLDHERRMIRDTSKFSGFKKYANGWKPALRVLAKEILKVDIQAGQHSSIEDARVTMLLFRKYKPAFDLAHASQYPDKQKQKPKAGKGKKTKKR